jgi:hypothetical protein
MPFGFPSEKAFSFAGIPTSFIQEAERRGKPEMVERACMKSETTPVAKAE